MITESTLLVFKDCLPVCDIKKDLSQTPEPNIELISKELQAASPLTASEVSPELDGSVPPPRSDLSSGRKVVSGARGSSTRQKARFQAGNAFRYKWDDSTGVQCQHSATFDRGC
jgi:hypothetical protein